jgi:carboxypeptidase Taq
MHWASGLIGYFATYLLGTVMSVQVRYAVAADVGDLEKRVERGDFAPLRDWVGEHVHADGRRFTPEETLRRGAGTAIDAERYLANLRRKYGARLAA